MSVLEAIRGRYAELRKSEQKVADIILADPSQMEQTNMVRLAAQAGAALEPQTSWQ